MILSPNTSQVTWAQNHFSGRVLAVESGDTLRVRWGTLTVVVRLHGVAIPTTNAVLLERARAYVTKRVGNDNIRVVVRGTAANRTFFGDVYPEGGELLNAELIRVGIATWARDYAPDRTDLREAEQTAQDAHRGLWSDPSGANVPLPTPTPAPTPTPFRPTPTPKPTATPQPTPTPEFPALPTLEPIILPSSAITPTPQPKPATPARNLRPILPMHQRPPEIPPLFPILALVFLGTMILLMMVQFVTGGRKVRALPAQLSVAILAGIGTAMIMPFLLYLFAGAYPGDLPTFITFILVGLLACCMVTAMRLQRPEHKLRVAPVFPIGETSSEGLVRLSGRTSTPQGYITSTIGNIPGIYIHECAFRYEPEGGRRGAGARYRWVPLFDETRTADFVLTDESGSVLVETAHGVFHPLRVARFYNDIPVEQFFAEYYSGDVRTEVFFIPPDANVTVWGRAYSTATPLGEQSERRIGYDVLTETLMIVEENPDRIFTRRPTVSLLLMLLAGILSFGIFISIVSPVTVIRLLMGAPQ